jgi:Zn-dependent peptidase ImmA (M78 family)/DNA-binding XRE family transcriptional regulator
MSAYSMSDLATLLSLTPQAISQYELGIISPSDNVMLKMADILNFPIEFFFKPIDKEPCVQSTSFFRRKKTVSVKQRAAFEEKANFNVEIADYLSQYVDFPDVDFPEMSCFSLKSDIEPTEMDRITAHVRKCWNIKDGPIDNLSDLLQQHGVIISRIEHPNTKMDAFSKWKNARPYIYLNTVKSSVRDRFDMAHELGHLLLHTDYTDADLSESVLYERVEDQANLFAGSFLMQSKEFFSEIITSSIDRLLVLKKKWKVPVSSMIYRIQDYDLLTTSQIEYLKRQMRERGMWRGEPFDDIAEYDAPDILKQAIDVVLKGKMASISEINNNIPIFSWMTESICCLPPGYLTQKQENQVCIKPRPQIVK